MAINDRFPSAFNRRKTSKNHDVAPDLMKRERGYSEEIVSCSRNRVDSCTEARRNGNFAVGRKPPASMALIAPVGLACEHDRELLAPLQASLPR
jgi:hypothetical protein